MPRIVSIIPPESKGTATLSTGTKVLLDNGEYLQHVNKITLVAEPGSRGRQSLRCIQPIKSK